MQGNGEFEFSQLRVKIKQLNFGPSRRSWILDGSHDMAVGVAVARYVRRTFNIFLYLVW